jgi:hypothetical protein
MRTKGAFLPRYHLDSLVIYQRTSLTIIRLSDNGDIRAGLRLTVHWKLVTEH